MKKENPVEMQLRSENEELRQQLNEAVETLDAIRNGKVDAIIVSGDDGDKIFSLGSAETPYRIIVEEMNQGSVSLSANGIILYCNRRFAELVSLPSEQIVGSDFARFVQEPELNKYKGLLKTGTKSKKKEVFSFLDKSGETLYFLVSLSPLPSNIIGDFCMLISDITDIKQMEIALRESHDKLEQRVIERTTTLAKTVDQLAESRQNAMQMMNEAVAARNELEIANKNLTNQILGRKQAQHALNESEIKYKNLVENSSIGVFQTKINGDIIYVNNAMVKIMDYDSVEQLKSVSSPMLYKDANQRHFLIGQLFEYGVVKDYEVTVITHSGAEKTLLVSNKLAGDTIDGTAFDITERKLAEAEIKLKNEKLQMLNATKDKFFSIIAHDLKSPFNAIMGFSEILVEQVNEEKYSGVAKYSKIIHSSSQRALDLLTNLMDWARSQTGRMEFIPEYFELVDFINDIIPIFTDIAGQKSITIFTDVPPNAPIFADQAMISTVFRNLISNAIKFTKPGGEIIIPATENQTEIVVSVKDNGVGIPRDMIGKLFRIDENYTTSGTNNERGTGLGLILCKEFIEKHGGKIWVESDEGKGSCFTFAIKNK